MNMRDKTLLLKFVEEAGTLEQILYGIDEPAFLASEEKMRAACMTLINIGELVKNLTFEVRENHPQIPWKSIAGFRDVASHVYFTLRMSDVWIFAAIELPEFAALVREMLDCEEKTH